MHKTDKLSVKSGFFDAFMDMCRSDRERLHNSVKQSRPIHVYVSVRLQRSLTVNSAIHLVESPPRPINTVASASVDWLLRAPRLKISTGLNAFMSSEDIGGMFDCKLSRAQPSLRPHQRFVTVPLCVSFRRTEVCPVASGGDMHGFNVPAVCGHLRQFCRTRRGKCSVTPVPEFQ